jgi:NADH:ubiquinone oxidoreductase subunit E
MSYFTLENRRRAEALVELYPEPRSATIPLCHLAQEQGGHLSSEAMEEIAQLTETTPAEVLGAASFYDMLHTEPVGTYLVGVCTNIACLLQGGEELLESAREVFGVEVGETSRDGLFTLEEVECVALCDQAPCAVVNYRFFGSLDSLKLERLRDDLVAGRLAEVVPPHGTLNRVERSAPPMIPMDEIDEERRHFDEQRRQRAQEKEGSREA